MQASYIDFENKFEYRPNHLNQPTIGVSFRGVCFLEDSQGNIIQMKIDSAVIPFSFPN